MVKKELQHRMLANPSSTPQQDPHDTYLGRDLEITFQLQEEKAIKDMIRRRRSAEAIIIPESDDSDSESDSDVSDISDARHGDGYWAGIREENAWRREEIDSESGLKGKPENNGYFLSDPSFRLWNGRVTRCRCLSKKWEQVVGKTD